MGRSRTVKAVTLGVLLMSVAVCLGGLLSAVVGPLHQNRLDREAAAIAARPFQRTPGEPLMVVTGSSTVRMWRGSAQAFPQAQVVNTAFGGSTMQSLLDHYGELIQRYAPDQVIIGSGDNDLAQGQTPDQVLAVAGELIARIERDLPGTAITIVAAKPSPLRWGQRRSFLELNADLHRLADESPDAQFVDMWGQLLDQHGRLRPDLYRADGLHLNARGYRIYATTLAAAAPNLSRPVAVIGAQAGGASPGPAPVPAGVRTMAITG